MTAKIDCVAGCREELGEGVESCPEVIRWVKLTGRRRETQWGCKSLWLLKKRAKCCGGACETS